MAVWTSQRLATLRQRSAELSEQVLEPTDGAAEALLEARWAQAAAYAAGLYQGQQTGNAPPTFPHS